MDRWTGGPPSRTASRAAWDRAVAAEAGADAYRIAAVFLAAWRYDSRLPEARALERYFAESRGVGPITVPELAVGRRLDGDEVVAVERVVTATRVLLRRAGPSTLTLYRGQPATGEW